MATITWVGDTWKNAYEASDDPWEILNATAKDFYDQYYGDCDECSMEQKQEQEEQHQQPVHLPHRFHFIDL